MSSLLSLIFCEKALVDLGILLLLHVGLIAQGLNIAVGCHRDPEPALATHRSRLDQRLYLHDPPAAIAASDPLTNLVELLEAIRDVAGRRRRVLHTS